MLIEGEKVLFNLLIASISLDDFKERNMEELT